MTAQGFGRLLRVLTAATCLATLGVPNGAMRQASLFAISSDQNVEACLDLDDSSNILPRSLGTVTKVEKYTSEHKGLTATVQNVKRQGEEIQFEYSLSRTSNALWILKPLLPVRITFFDSGDRRMGNDVQELFRFDGRFLNGLIDVASNEVSVVAPIGARQMAVELGGSGLTVTRIGLPPDARTRKRMPAASEPKSITTGERWDGIVGGRLTGETPKK